MIYSIINGCGHMWYLPMLFWCFVFGWLLEQIRIKDGWKMTVLILLNLVALVSLPLRISSALTFMVYFYAGFLFYKHAEKIKSKITPKWLVISWIVFVVCFIIFRPLRGVLVTDEGQNVYLKLMVYVGNNACKLLYASSGLLAFYSTAVYYTKQRSLSNITITIAACCFGIYLFQQFVLQLLYYKTNFPIWVGPYCLPWCGFVIASVVSFVLSKLLLKTKTGRFLIG